MPGNAKAVSAKDAGATSGTPVNDFVFRHFHESEAYNPIKSGRNFLGERITSYSPYDTVISISKAYGSGNSKIKVGASARSNYATSLAVSVNNSLLGSLSFSSTTTKYGDFVFPATSIFGVALNSSKLALNFAYKGDAGSTAWLDYIVLNIPLKLEYSEHLVLTNPMSYNPQAQYRFQLQKATDNVIVWDVTNIHSPVQLNGSLVGNSYYFSVTGAENQTFIAFSKNGSFKNAILQNGELGLGPVANQNLSGTDPVDYIIVSPKIFRPYAEDLAAFHREKSGLKVKVVEPDEIYNEFSSGAPDVSALRDYFKHVYETYGIDHVNSLKYVLLFGDGSYLNKDAEKNSNFVLTYQSANSYNESLSFVGDDYFSFFDDNEGDNGGAMDIAIGRLVAGSETQAKELVEKIKSYYSKEAYGSWRNQILFIGDDEDSNLHMRQSNDLTKIVEQDKPAFVLHKVFLDAYNQTVTSTGAGYPEVNKAITDYMNQGVLIFNYTGHGGEGGLAHERILKVQDIQNWKNPNTLPLFVTATCELSRFDDYNNPSAGEYILLNPEGGGIALLTTTRLAYSSDNEILNTAFYNTVFKLDKNNQKLKIGEIVRRTKNDTKVSTNKRNFSLLGDPAAELNYPVYKVVTDSISGKPANQFTDTIGAFGFVTVTGYITDNFNNFLNTYSGEVFPVVMDKEKEVVTLNNDNILAGPFSFAVRNNILYKGKATVANGRFKYSFYVPKDIAYNVGKGKLHYYVHNGLSDGHGNFDSLLIGGNSGNHIVDNTPPEIDVFLNDSNFVNGGTTNESPALIIKLNDNYGVNTSGIGVGHDISAVVDNNENNTIILNEYYEADKDSYKSGKVSYQLTGLEPGKHKLTIKAWDIANNSTQAELDFVVSESDGLVLAHVLNYPNPFSARTEFMFEHNQPGALMYVQIQVFTVSGQVIKSINQQISPTGFGPEKIKWDGRDEFGDKIAKGVYLYRLKVQTVDGLKAEKYQKLVIIN
ncbi:MAG: type IX secretion system sortase PorU [Bacteroidales bacterium]|nr:type IX secretion system sortase PorU [Bacteroidales bacterium]